LNKINEIDSWISANPNADLAEYEAKQRDLERAANPIMSKMYQGAGAPPSGAQFGQQQQQAHTGPSVDEVD
jgi:heat shock protein 1/8